jgi:hypothetical protein
VNFRKNHCHHLYEKNQNSKNSKNPRRFANPAITRNPRKPSKIPGTS